MLSYLDKIDDKKREYFTALEAEIPTWIEKYINTKELLKQQYISVTCGTLYTKLYDSNYFFSSLDHSIGVALIIWHFTHDKKQTVAGLFHDIATPVFKHCIDFLNGDYMTQESTENLTTSIISNSSEIMSLLKEDNILLEEINDYHIYPIADNDTPMLSSDRLEYSLSNALFTYNLLNLDEIKEIYNDIEIEENEDKIIELGFKTKNIAEKFVDVTSKLSVIYRSDKTRYSMQFLADIVKKLSEENLITMDDLYNMKEREVINIIENSKYKNEFNTWINAKDVYISKVAPVDLYYVKCSAKIRYIDPLINNIRASKKSLKVENLIKENFLYDMSNYVYLILKL